MKKLWIAVVMMLLLCTPLSAFAQSDGYIEAQSANAPIVIDGYFDDWEGYEKGVITYYNNNQLCENHALLLRDDEYLYLYVDMHNLYTAQIPLDSYYLNIAGKQLQFFMKYPKADGTPDWGEKLKKLPDGVYGGIGVFTYYPNYCWGDAQVEIATPGAYNDRMELRMKISEVESLMGLAEGTIASGTKVEVTMPNVGQGNIFVEGSSTGILAGLAILIIISAIAAKKGLRRHA